MRNYSLENVTILENMTSLIKADLKLLDILFLDYEEEYVIAVQFLHYLCYFKCLNILIHIVEKFVDLAGLDSMVKFDNLTQLEIESWFDFHELVKFLEAADNLQFLTFSLDEIYDTYREPKRVPTCMLSCLKTVRIIPWRDLNAYDFETIRYVLRSALVLERLEIHHSNSYCNKSHKEELEMLERGSGSCQFAFY